MLLGEETARGTVRRGSSGADVQALQERLQKNGYPGLAVDGKFGPSTENAVRGFQAAHGLAVDGIVGPQTWAALGVGVTPAGQIVALDVAGAPGSMPWGKIAAAALLVGGGLWWWSKRKRR